jgi:hypothetical protein
MCGFGHRIRRLRLDGRPKRTRLTRFHPKIGSVWTGPKCIRTPDFSHSLDFSLRTFRETQGELPSEASVYCMPVLLFVDACCDVSLFVPLLQIYDQQLPASIVCFLHLNISSVLDTISDRRTATTALNL